MQIYLPNMVFQAECCPYDMYDTCHCSKHEVQVFGNFLQNILNDDDWNYDTEKNNYVDEKSDACIKV